MDRPLKVSPVRQFGQLLRELRQGSRDPLRNRPLTQERLGELIGDELGDSGYSGAAVSDWERERSKINADDRLVLVGLLSVLRKCGGLSEAAEANKLLIAGNYRLLDDAEYARVFPDRPRPGGLDAIVGPGEGGRLPVLPKSDRGLLKPARRRQLILLEKVRNFWVKGVLEQSFRDSPKIELVALPIDGAIEHPWKKVIGPAVIRGVAGPISGTISGAYLDADRALLLLGDPGSGKTSSLIALADDLIALAEEDPSEPIPVLLNLLSWSEGRLSLAEWLVEEMTTKYQIPRQLGRRWLQKDNLTLLLDGFDEMAPRYRPDCARAINQFREAHGLVGIVVCSRTAEYLSCGVKLRMGGAIQLQPLSQEQVENYLREAGPGMEPLQVAVRGDKVVNELAQSPLMLRIMSLAAADRGEELVDMVHSEPAGVSGDLVWRRDRLFEAYVDHAFGQRTPEPEYGDTKIRGWLAWMARMLSLHNQRTLLIERLQPSWLPSERWRWTYMLLSRIVTGLYAGVIIWLTFIVLRIVIPQLPSGVSGRVAERLNISLSAAIFLTWMGINVFLGIGTGFLHGYIFEARGKRPVEEGTQNRGVMVATGLMTGLLTLILVYPFDQPLIALSWALLEALLFMILTRHIRRHSYRTEIRAVEALGWSWVGALKGIVYALLIATLTELIETILFGFNGIYRTYITFTLGGFTLGGLQGRRVEEKSEPNQGVLLSIRNAALGAMLTGIPFGLLSWYFRDWATAWRSALLMALISIPGFGGSNVMKHYLVRLLLWRAKQLPLDLRAILDHAVRLALMRRVGGGYIYIHHLLQEHFGKLDSKSPLLDQR